MKRFRFLAHPVPPKQILNFETKKKTISKIFIRNIFPTIIPLRHLSNGFYASTLYTSHSLDT